MGSLAIVASCADAAALPTVQGGPDLLCTPALLEPFRVVIRPEQAPPVWGEWHTGGGRFEILWPPGFRLQLSPSQAVVDQHGHAVAMNGDLIDDAGGSGDDPAVICMINGESYPLS